MKTILLGLVILGSTACLGDDPDHMGGAVSGVQESPEISKFAVGVPSAFHGRLLQMISTMPTAPSTNTAGVRVDLLSNWAMTIDAPDLCQGCTATLVHDKLDVLTAEGATNTITVWDDARTINVCAISLRLDVNSKTIILADTCGTSIFDVGTPPVRGGARE